MNRVSRRASAVFLLIAILVGGLGFFLYEYFTLADQWVVSAGSPHIYNSTNIGCGQVVDRSGLMLLDLTATRVYAENETVRKATLHWLGDREGRISAPAVSTYAKEMTGYDMVNGLYSYGNAAGQAVLTLSSEIQKTALEALGDRKGTIGVYNYKTGEILCAVTSPVYDPDQVPDIEGDTTDRYEGIYLNRFTQSTYVPGSIFKAVTTAAALECVPDIQEMTFKCSGVYAYGKDKVTCATAHGKQSLKTAMANSCNCAYAQIVEKIGKENMIRYVEQFQVMESVKFDGITTAQGNYDVTNAAAVQLAWSGIGQHTDLVNPCRFMTFMGAIAGGGKAAEPYVVSQVSLEEEITYTAETTETLRIMSAETAEILQTYMRNNVQTVYGTGNFPGLTVCAKSGTSQLGGDEKDNAMFAGFVTDEQYPLAFIVVVEHGGFGSSTCVPILSKVLASCKAVLDAA
ncbi:MAG: penicillin-binding protein [Oscillospiraceae bacterium]|nr:penicillin-binding protein [Oscillospiraceae bacterium]